MSAFWWGNDFPLSVCLYNEYICLRFNGCLMPTIFWPLNKITKRKVLSANMTLFSRWLIWGENCKYIAYTVNNDNLFIIINITNSIHLHLTYTVKILVKATHHKVFLVELHFYFLFLCKIKMHILVI